jgi:hypothetical protein
LPGEAAGSGEGNPSAEDAASLDVPDQERVVLPPAAPGDAPAARLLKGRSGIEVSVPPARRPGLAFTGTVIALPWACPAAPCAAVRFAPDAGER